MKKLIIRLLYALIGILLISTGFIIAKFIEFPNFEISKTIDLLDCLSLITTIFLALLITLYFDKQNSNNRTEKDIIIRKVENVYDVTSTLQKDAVSGSIPYTDATSALKRINVMLNSIYKTVERCEFSIKDDIKESLKNSLGDLRDLLTDTPRISDEEVKNFDLPIEVKDGIVHFNRQRSNKIESNFDSLKDLLLELEIRINKK